MKAESSLESTVCLSICSQIILFLPALSSITLEDQSVLTGMLHSTTQQTSTCAFLACTGRLLFLAITSQRMVLPRRRGSLPMQGLRSGAALQTHCKQIPIHTSYFQSFWPWVKSCHVKIPLASTVSTQHCLRLYGKLEFFSMF